MKPVRDAAHFNALVKGLKAEGKKVLTNSYLLPDEIDYYAGRQRLHFIALNTGLLFLCGERDLQTGYFYLDAERFQETEVDLDGSVSSLPVVINQIFLDQRKPGYLEKIEGLWIERGFALKGQFKRLTLNMAERKLPPANQNPNGGKRTPRFAQKEQCREIQVLWKNNLDILSAPLPFDEELEEAIARREVPLIMDESGKVMAAMQFTRKGKVALINHVVVDQQFRRQGLAVEMLRDCFDRNADIRQVILWVEENNLPAESLYTKIGFCRDGKISRQLLLY